eukprot:5407808-Prymnesium_polylepis.1
MVLSLVATEYPVRASAAPIHVQAKAAHAAQRTRVCGCGLSRASPVQSVTRPPRRSVKPWQEVTHHIGHWPQRPTRSAWRAGFPAQPTEVMAAAKVEARAAAARVA